MTQMQSQLKERQQKIEKFKQEQEEIKKKEEERKQREQERKQKELENKRQMEEQLKQTEVEALNRIQEQIDDHSVGSNPLFEHIELCEQLKKYCLKQLKGPEQEEKVQSKQEETKVNNELDSKLKKGNIMAAHSKTEELIQVGGGKNKKGRGKKANEKDGESKLEFPIVRKFNTLKISPPITEE